MGTLRAMNNSVVWTIVGILLIVVLLIWLLNNGGDGDAVEGMIRAVR